MKTVSGLTPSNPIKFVAWPDPEPPNTSTETPGVDGPFMVGAPHGSVWYAIASTLTDESIRAGTPGTLDIQDTLSDYDFNAGDTVAIINPLSGVFETLLVANTTTNGQTALTVTGSIVGTYPAGSPIVRIPRIGGPFSLPGGVAGQIMRHDGTKWTAYGTTALADGVVLTWTDAGGWAAAALPASAAPLSGVVGQIAFFNTSTTITTEAGSGENALTWNPADKRFGIGTTNPSDKLHLSGPLANTDTNFGGQMGVQCQNTNTANGNYSSFLNLDANGNVNSGIYFKNVDHTNEGRIDFITRYSGGFSQRMSIAGNGKIGIGNTSPQQTLHVTGTARITGSDGTATTIMGRDADGDISAVSLGSTLSITAGTLNSTNQTITLSGDVTGSGTTAITTAIANNAVTVAKMAQLAGLSILGRSANSTGNMAAITASVALSYLRLNAGGTALEWGTLPASGTLTGNGVANRVPYYSGTTSFTNDDGFTFDPTNHYLQISSQATPTTPSARLDLRYDTTVGSAEWLRVNGNFSGNLTSTIFNTRNAGASGDNIFSLVTGGASGGDPILQFIISGVETWSIGVDNSDADKLKIKPQASPGAGASGGEGITMTTAVTPLVGINTDAPAHPLDVNGFARALTYTSRTDATGGTVTFGTGAGSGPSLFAVVLPNGNMCTVRWTQGTSGTAGGRVLNIAIPTVLRHASKIYVTFSANNDLTARDIAKFSIDYSGTTPGSIALKSNALLTALDDGGDYSLTMHITGHA